MGAKTLYIELGLPWENGYVESINGKLRDELLDREVFYTLLQVQVLTESGPTAPWATGHRRRKLSCPRTLSQCWPD